ncbi:GlxA family transcriptional regulator [Leisingera sp.]|uniref:GlxA family transcriptional regulator n=1 Tax=Leisingera sp. TaxID=1879318 RepID=UPI002B273BCE|nr:DJ-1/PfpI family protein [Leisingera sp.]
MAKPTCPSRRIDVLLFDGVNALDVSGPVQAFAEARREGSMLYVPRFVSMGGKPVRASCGLSLTADAPVDAKSDADDLLVPGGVGIDPQLMSTELVRTVSAWTKGRSERRVIAVCSGALLLAQAGVLDGLAATTHWSRAAMVRDRFPAVRWEMDRIYVEHPHVMTSAGVTAGIDLALAVIRRDHGPTVALTVGRELVVQTRRSGGQAQFSPALDAQHSAEPAIALLVEAIVSDPSRDWTLAAMAAAAATSERTLSRRFHAATSSSPSKFVERIRVEHARDGLSSGTPIQTVAARSGFGDAQRMRRAFVRHLGVTAADYAKMFG